MKSLWFLLALAACGESKSVSPGGPPATPVTPGSSGALVRDAQVPVDADVAALAGDKMYAALCAPCHGTDLRGYGADNAPSLVTQSFLESASNEFLERSIATGRPGTSMAAYGKKLGGPLDDAAIERLVGYIRAQGVPAIALPAVPTGDAAAGAPLYLTNCVVCHGDRQSRREGIHLANMMFQAQASDAFIKHAIVNGRLGTKMVAFGQILSDKDINDLVAFIRTFGPAGGQSATQPQVMQLPAPTGKEPLVIHPKGKDPGWKLREDRFVSVDAANAAYKAGAKMVIIDARPPSDWMRSHIEGAVSIPYHDMKRLADIPKDTWVITYCACPHHLSGLVVDELRKRGHLKSAVLDEGINDWHRKGYPMTVAEGVTAPIAEDHTGHAH